MTMELQVTSVLPIINTENYDIVKNNLIQSLQPFKIGVTLSNLAEAKKKATELNKIHQDYDNKRKQVLAIIKEPIVLWDNKMKELAQLPLDYRKELVDQIKVFEDKRRAECLELCKLSLQELYAKFEIQDEFKTITIEDLAIISNITETDKLTKATQDTIANRVQAVFNLQSTICIRLAELENACLKAGLKTPLERRQVESFLKLDEVTYNNELQKILGNEIKRQQEIEARAEAEMQRKLEQEKLRIQAEERAKAEALARAELVEKQRAEAIEKIKKEQEAPTVKVQEIVEVKNGVVRVEITFLADIPENTFNQLVSQNAWNDTIKKQFSSYVNESVKIKNV